MKNILQTLKNNMTIKTSNPTDCEKIKLESPKALTMFFMNNPELCSGVMKDVDESTRQHIISEFLDNTDVVNNHQICLLIAKYGNLYAITRMMFESPFDDVIREAKFRLTAIELNSLMDSVDIIV